MEARIRLQPGAADQLRLLVRIVVSSPVLLLILLLAVSAAAEPFTPGDSPVLAVAPPRALTLAAPERAGTRIFGLDVFAMTGSLADDRQHLDSGYARPWGRGPHEFAEGALGVAWGWRF